MILLNSQLLQTFLQDIRRDLFILHFEIMSRVSQLNVFFALGESKLFFFTTSHTLFRCICPKQQKSSNQNTEIIVLINSCICRRITAVKILASACQAKLLYFENFSCLRRTVMIKGLTLTPYHKQERTVSVLKFYSSSRKEF